LSGELNKAIHIWGGLAPLMRAVHYEPGVVQVMVLLGQGFLLAGDLDKAKKTIDECIELSERYGMRLYLGRSHYISAEIILKTNPKQAASHLKKSVAILQKIKAAPYLARAYAGYGRYYNNQGQIRHAKEYFTKSLEIFERLGDLIEPEKIRKEMVDLSKC